MKLPSAILTTACLCATGVAGAAEWSAAPVISWTMDHDTNRNLGASDESSQGGFLQLDLPLRRATGTSTLMLSPHVGWQRFTNDVAQNAENMSLEALGAWTRDRGVLSAQAEIARDDTLNNELADTGVLTGSTRRDSKSASVSWNYEQSSRRQLGVQLGYTDIEYENEQFFYFFGQPIPIVSLYGYRYPSASITQSVQWTERSSLQFTTYANRLISQNDDQGDAADTNNYGARVGFTRALTTRVGLVASAGVSRQSSDETSKTGYIGRFELTRTDELGQWSLFAERNVAPSSYGFLITRNEAGLAFNRRLAPRWSTQFSARNLWNEDIESRQSGALRRYERAEAGLTWQASRTWRISTSMAYSRAQLREGAALADASRVMVAAVWAPLPSRLSR